MEIGKLLVANRGEIAARIFSTCDRLGIETVAVAAPDDMGAFHTRRAGQVEEVRGYLDIAGIVDAARRSGAEAVHPGYGFLAENPVFAEAVVAAGLRFVGPSPAAREDTAGWTPPDEPVLLVALGTAFNERPEFYRTCLEAFDGHGPVAMAVGERVRIDDLGPVPGNVDVRPWFPQPAVLRHARAFVSHAGMGSTMEALYYGVPLVCVPQMLEQGVNAARVAELGLGVRLDPGGLTPEDLRAAVDAVTTDPATRAALDRMREAIRRAGGAVAAADAIETHLAP